MTTPAHPDPIRIPFATKRVLVSGDVYRTDTCGIDITPDIARQIMALAGIPALEGERINAVEQRIAALEGILIRNTKKVLAAPFNAAESVPAPASGGDEAAVKAMLAVYRSAAAKDIELQRMPDGKHRFPTPEIIAEREMVAMRAILAAIRSGAIPLPEDVPRVAALRARLVEAERASHSVTGCDQCAEHKADTEAMRDDRDALAKRLAEAEEESKHLALHHEAAEKDKCHYRADRDLLAAQVEGLTRERERALQCHGDVPCGACITCLNGKLDRALADLAAERAAREKVEKLANRCRCIYCDADLSEADVEGNGAVIRAHIEVCPKHPLSAAQAKLAKAVESLRWARQRIRPSIDGPRDFAFEDEIKRLDALLVEIGGGT